MSLFRKKCAYCKMKIEKGKELLRAVKDPVYIGTKQKVFCCDKHADLYEEEISNVKKSAGGCCG